MKPRNVILSVILLFSLVGLIVVVSFLEWLDEQPAEIDIISLVNEMNSKNALLSSSRCDPNLIGELEELVELQESYLSFLEISERENLYADLINSYSKLGYVYDMASQDDESNRNYSIAVVYGQLASPEFDWEGRIRELAIESDIGCIP